MIILVCLCRSDFLIAEKRSEAKIAFTLKHSDRSEIALDVPAK